MSVALARKFRCDVTTDLTLASGFIELKAITDFDPEIAPNMQDATRYDTNGWSSWEPTMQSWSATATILRQQIAGVYDPGAELVRATVGQFGTAARVGLRWYDKTGGPEAFSGVAVTTWKRTNTGVANLEGATLTFAGTDVPLNMNITNPGVAPAVPTVISATPSGVAAGGIVNITGVNFTGTIATTGVKFNAVNATSWIVVSDNTIVAVMPAGSAGSGAIIVTNAVGASTSFAYTRA